MYMISILAHFGRVWHLLHPGRSPHAMVGMRTLSRSCTWLDSLRGPRRSSARSVRLELGPGGGGHALVMGRPGSLQFRSNSAGLRIRPDLAKTPAQPWSLPATLCRFRLDLSSNLADFGLVGTSLGLFGASFGPLSGLFGASLGRLWGFFGVSLTPLWGFFGASLVRGLFGASLAPL